MAMASTSSTLTISSSSTLVDGKALRQATSTQCVSLPTLPPFHSHNRSLKINAYCGKVARNVVAMATGEAPAEVASDNELPEFVKTLQATWDKVEDKYAVSSLIIAAVIVLWGSTGLISAIDRIPLIPGILEIVGIGYTGWFVYKNLVFKPDREALFRKIEDTYSEVIGSSSN